MNQPGAWARKVIPAWCDTRIEAARRLGVSPRWLRELIKRHDVKVYYVRRWVRIAPGLVCVRYALAIPPGAVEELAAKRLAADTDRFLQIVRSREGSPGRWRPHRRRWTL